MRFPFDSAHFDFTVQLEPGLPLERVRLINRVPGFVLDPESFTAKVEADGTMRVIFDLNRHRFTQLLVILLFFAALIFGVLILFIERSEAVAVSLSSFFFSLWSIRGILEPQILTFPILFDYCMLILCCFVLCGLLWRMALAFQSNAFWKGGG